MVYRVYHVNQCKIEINWCKREFESNWTRPQEFEFELVEVKFT